MKRLAFLLVPTLLLIACVARVGHAQQPDSVKVCRAPSCRSTTQKNHFMRLTGFRKGRPGWVVDHMKPLECGGEDLPTNMMWQTVDEAKAKDKIERDCSRWLP